MPTLCIRRFIPEQDAHTAITSFMLYFKRDFLMRHSLSASTCSALLMFIAAVQPARAQYPQADDVASPEAIVEAAYGSLLRKPGENFQWDRFRSLFLPQATLLPNSEQTGGTYRVLSPEGFIAWVDSLVAANDPIGSDKDKGFAEEAIRNEVHRYGDIAHVFSTYQKHYWSEDEILGRGINSFQLVFRKGRWWIVAIVWDEENGAGPIPAAYLQEGDK